MATKLSQRDLDPEKVYVAWTSGVTELSPGREVSFRRGQEFRGSAAIVRARPNLFVAQGTPPDEWPSELAAADASFAAVDREYRAEQARREPPPIPVDRRVVCVQAFRAGARAFGAGQTYDLNDAAVQANKGFFTWPPKPLT